MSYFLLILAIIFAIAGLIAANVGFKNDVKALSIGGTFVFLLDVGVSVCYLFGIVIPLLVVFIAIAAGFSALALAQEDLELNEFAVSYAVIGLFFYGISYIIWYQQNWFQTLADACCILFCIITICMLFHTKSDRIPILSSIYDFILIIAISYLINAKGLDRTEVYVTGIIGAAIIYVIRSTILYFYYKKREDSFGVP